MEKDQLSLEELSAAAGMTARNVRAYQTKGLIPPPMRAGRRSVYGAEHLHRLQAIERARSRGASLSLIAAHLAQGRPLDDDTLVDWHPASHDITPLLTRPDIQREAAAQACVDELVRAGVFRPEGRRLFTGREVAEALMAAHGQGLPLHVALGVAQRALRAAIPLAATIRESSAARPVAARQLAEVAGSVLRHVISSQARPSTGGSPNGSDEFDLDR